MYALRLWHCFVSVRWCAVVSYGLSGCFLRMLRTPKAVSRVTTWELQCNRILNCLSLDLQLELWSLRLYGHIIHIGSCDSLYSGCQSLTLRISGRTLKSTRHQSTFCQRLALQWVTYILFWLKVWKSSSSVNKSSMISRPEVCCKSCIYI